MCDMWPMNQPSIMVVRQSRQTSWWVLPCVRLTSICKSPTSSTLCTKCRIFLLCYCAKNQNQPCTSIQSPKTMILLWSNCFRGRHWNLWHHSCCHVRSFLSALTRITIYLVLALILFGSVDSSKPWASPVVPSRYAILGKEADRKNG